MDDDTPAEMQINSTEDSEQAETVRHLSWKGVAAILYDELHEIDKVLSQANMPINSRPSKAFDIIRNTMLEVSDCKRKAFFLSEEHGKIRIIINDWYSKRYGKKPERDEGAFSAALLIHGTPFILRVPKSFEIAADEPNTIWVGCPADELDTVRKEALQIANLVRSIDFDTRSLRQDDDLRIVQLANSVRTDIQNSAENLCVQDEARLRSAGWNASQASEKAIKILIQRYGQIPPNSHDLLLLAQKAERLGAQTIDRELLKKIPSGKDATDLRYDGKITLANATEAYHAALFIIRQITFEAKPDAKYNAREARFKLKLPPWFNFDTHEFRQRLNLGITSIDEHLP